LGIVPRLCLSFPIAHGLQPSSRGLLISGASIVTLILLNLVVLRVLKRDHAKVLFMGFGALLAFSLLSINTVWLFLGAYLFWNLLLATQSPFTKPLIHEGLPSSHRSTAMSGYSALVSLIGFGGSSLIGVLVQQANTPRAAYMLFAGISLMVLIPCAIWLAGHLKDDVEGA
jgi:MFS family permease